MRQLNKFLPGLLLSAALAWAQSVVPIVPPPPPPPAADQNEAPTFTADTRLVVVHASVLDKNGKLITDIPESGFKVYENGIEQPIKIFRREDVPVSMGIIIDNSGSMSQKRTSVAAAALALVKNSNPQDEVFIVNFSDDAYLDQPLTSSLKKLEEALDRLDARGGTAMRDALSMSIDYVKDKGKKDKKVLMVITDGDDNASNESLEQLVRKAQQSEVLIYSIALLDEEVPRRAKNARRAMKELAEASGGVDFYPKTLAEVEQITPRVAHEIRNQYILAYSPLNQNLDGTFRSIKVVVNGYGKPTVRTRNGYYASPAPPPKPQPSASNK
jgi:Ca-activated chloride channel family protein